MKAYLLLLPVLLVSCSPRFAGMNMPDIEPVSFEGYGKVLKTELPEIPDSLPVDHYWNTRPAVVTGKVVRISADSLSGMPSMARVECRCIEGCADYKESYVTTTDSSGHYSVNVPSGIYSIYFSNWDSDFQGGDVYVLDVVLPEGSKGVIDVGLKNKAHAAGYAIDRNRNTVSYRGEKNRRVTKKINYHITIKGKALDQKSGKPVKGAIAWIPGNLPWLRQAEVITDKHGKYILHTTLTDTIFTTYPAELVNKRQQEIHFFVTHPDYARGHEINWINLNSKAEQPVTTSLLARTASDSAAVSQQLNSYLWKLGLSTDLKSQYLSVRPVYTLLKSDSRDSVSQFTGLMVIEVQKKGIHPLQLYTLLDTAVWNDINIIQPVSNQLWNDLLGQKITGTAMKIGGITRYINVDEKYRLLFAEKENQQEVQQVKQKVQE